MWRKCSYFMLIFVILMTVAAFAGCGSSNQPSANEVKTPEPTISAEPTATVTEQTPEPTPTPTEQAPEPTPAPTAATVEGWTPVDIGDTGGAGSFTLKDGVFTINGIGDNIWYNQDQFYFIYQQLSGDCQIIAKVADFYPINEWSKAGIMIRESLEPISQHFSASLTQDHGVSAVWRKNPEGDSADTTPQDLKEKAPVWLKVTRVKDGEQFLLTAYRSADGTTWTEFAHTKIKMSDTIYIGLSVTSLVHGTPIKAVIDNVSLGPISP